MPIRAVPPLIAMALVLAACGGDSNNDATAIASPPVAASPSPPAAATTPPTSCPVEGTVCAFAREVAGLVASAQYDAVAARARPFDYTCPGDKPAGAGGPFPLCEGAAAGDRRIGYSVGALQSEGAVVSREGLVEVLATWINGNQPPSTVTSGNQPALATVGCPLVGDAAMCSDRFVFVLVRGDGTSLLRFGVQRDGTASAPQITQTITGFTAVNRRMVSGGDDDLPAIFGIDQGVGTRYFVVD